MKSTLSRLLLMLLLMIMHLDIVAADQAIVTAEVSVGELVDKITILQIKTERITDEKKLRNVRTELATLLQTFGEHVTPSKELDTLMQELRTVNEELWDIEDDIREKEHKQEFDQEFIKIARSVYFTNDRRCAIKRAINELCGSRLVEEKSYTEYRQPAAAA